ncbi:telomerase reverse transcriptase-like isoform X2 [Cataglyphis hispanica]|uniref:telomerase reverse transcriptase-like isoform X2 n=1 Tax=Cataglyphis hispanica TaxID=1086592 RepID=UPI00217F8AB9|nr:telomerase reverse transcriptase-like isoform X2 [Cataglyphis hispanica]
MKIIRIKMSFQRCRIRKTGRTTAKISKYHILESGNVGQTICHDILNTDIGLNKCYRNINFNVVTPILSPILESFRNRHNRFNYSEKLKCIIARDSNKYEKQKKYKNQIDRRSLKSFFNLLLDKNIPLQLFGTRKNFKVIKRRIGCLLRTVPKNNIIITKAFKRTVKRKKATGASLNMQPLFNKFDISNIEWLHLINNDTIRWIIVLKLLHWFFARYIIKILHQYVVLLSLRSQWVYIAKDDWCNMQEEFIKKKINTCGLIPCTPRKIDKLKFNIPVGTYRYIPTSSGLRALLITKYNIKKEFDDVDVVLRFLQQLYVTYFNENGTPTTASCKQTIFKFQASTKNPLYCVRCDIQDAFGSIIQEKLYDIITTCCKDLKLNYGNYIVLRRYTTSKNRKRIETVQFLSHYLKKAINKKAIMNKKKPKLVEVGKLLAKINKLIFEQKVKIDCQVYSIKHGVPQGMRISPILSDIYYENMLKEIFFVYKNNGLLCRYVDDILYITENEHYATEFLKTIKNGVPEYNVKFNLLKIQSNLGLQHKTKINFLGWNIII